MTVSQRLSLFFGRAKAYHFAPLFTRCGFPRGLCHVNRRACGPEYGRLPTGDYWRALPRCEVSRLPHSPAAQNMPRRDSNPEFILLDGTKFHYGVVSYTVLAVMYT